MLLLLTFVVALIIPLTEAAHRGEGCYGNPNCIDTGLTCTGARCYCLTDISAETARFWACNVDADCPVVNSNRIRRSSDTETSQQNSVGFRAATLEGNTSGSLKCIPSTECPLVPGFTGYCNIERYS